MGSLGGGYVINFQKISDVLFRRRFNFRSVLLSFNFEQSLDKNSDILLKRRPN